MMDNAQKINTSICVSMLFPHLLLSLLSGCFTRGFPTNIFHVAHNAVKCHTKNDGSHYLKAYENKHF
jgi:hypothetical protein